MAAASGIRRLVDYAEMHNFSAALPRVPRNRTETAYQKRVQEKQFVYSSQEYVSLCELERRDKISKASRTASPNPFDTSLTRRQWGKIYIAWRSSIKDRLRRAQNFHFSAPDPSEVPSTILK
jgi:hypothetical protein